MRVTELTAAKRTRKMNEIIRVAHVQANGSRGELDGIGRLSSWPRSEMRKTLPATSSTCRVGDGDRRSRCFCIEVASMLSSTEKARLREKKDWEY